LWRIAGMRGLCGFGRLEQQLHGDRVASLQGTGAVATVEGGSGRVGWLGAGSQKVPQQRCGISPTGHAELLLAATPSPEVAVKAVCTKGFGRGRGCETASRQRGATAGFGRRCGCKRSGGWGSACRDGAAGVSRPNRGTRRAARRWNVAFRARPRPVSGPGGPAAWRHRPAVWLVCRLRCRPVELLRATFCAGESNRLKVVAAAAGTRGQERTRRREETTRAIATESPERGPAQGLGGGRRPPTWRGRVRRDQKSRPDVRGVTRSQARQCRENGVGVAQKRGIKSDQSNSGWGTVWFERLQHTASAGRAIPLGTVATLSRVGHVQRRKPQEQEVFECEACTDGRCNADVHAASPHRCEGR